MKMIACNGLEIQIGDVWKVSESKCLIVSAEETGLIKQSGEAREWQFKCINLTSNTKMTLDFGLTRKCYTLLARVDSDVDNPEVE